MTRLEALERVAAAAQNVRNLERMLITAKDTRLVADRLHEARQFLDEALEDLKQQERD